MCCPVTPPIGILVLTDTVLSCLPSDPLTENSYYGFSNSSFPGNPVLSASPYLMIFARDHPDFSLPSLLHFQVGCCLLLLPPDANCLSSQELHFLYHVSGVPLHVMYAIFFLGYPYVPTSSCFAVRLLPLLASILATKLIRSVRFVPGFVFWT